MIAYGLFDRHPKLQVLIVHMGGGLASIVGRLEFNWRLNYNGIKNPPAGKPYTNKRSPFDYFKTNILVDCMGFNAIGVRAAIEMCGVDRVVFGTDFGPVPYASVWRSRPCIRNSSTIGSNSSPITSLAAATRRRRWSTLSVPVVEPKNVLPTSRL